MDPQQETIIWEGSPSQWTNFPVYVICGLLFWLVVPIFVALWRWIETRAFVYKLTTERVVITRGVFSKRTDELELYRVKDTALLEPFWLRLVSLGHIDLTTSDHSTPTQRIQAVKNAAALRENLRRNIERLRTLKGIRELDVGEVIR